MKKTFTLLKAFGCLFTLVCTGMVDLQAQTPFDGPNYANHWIVPGQTYVRVEVTKQGLYTVAKSLLAATFPEVSDITKFHIFHRGKEVQILSTDGDKLLFYGEPNDGSTDSLLYRPYSARGNRYISLFSDKGVYFITANATSATPVTVHNQPLSGDPEPYHLHSDTTVFKDEYSQSTRRFIPTPFQSYFENEETWGSPAIGTSPRPIGYSYNIKLVNAIEDLSINSSIEVMVIGRRENTRTVKVTVGVNLDNQNQIGGSTFYGFSGRKINATFSRNYLNSDGTGVLSINLDNPVDGDRASIVYYSFTYPQKFIVPGAGSYQFNLIPGASNGWSRIKIENITATTRVYDITDAYVPKELATTKNLGDNTLEVMVPRTIGTSAKLYVSNSATEISMVTTSNMQFKEAGSTNYMIITNDDLYDVVNNNYRPYRASAAGGSFKVSVFKIKDIYDQFNYGEPSPVAIRRFVDYMISDENTNKYLLLVGPSTTVPELLVKDLPGEVPAVGFPGSDILLVTGLGGSHRDVPAIAVGRIAASNQAHVTNYLAKLQAYESSATSSPWRKHVLQMYGAKSVVEANLFISYLQPLQAMVGGGPFNGNVTLVEQPSPSNTSSPANISTQINDGVGLLTYFGHGEVAKTWYDVGRVTNNTFHYANANKYPIMYFNGCGIGNIFANSDNPISFDWIVAPSLGSVAFVTNSYLSYGTPSALHLEAFYKQIFSYDDASRKRIGDILNDVAKAITSRPGYNMMDVQNLHQVILQGDPALRVMVTTETALPVSLYNFSGHSVNNDVLLSWITSSELDNERFDVQWSKDAKSFETIGSLPGKGTVSNVSNYSWRQYDVPDGLYYYRLKQLDEDGKYSYSDVISVRVGKNVAPRLSPNPVEQVMRISGGKSFEYKVAIFSTSGVSMYEGVTTGELNVDFLSPGIYLVQLTSESGVIVTERMVKK